MEIFIQGAAGITGIPTTAEYLESIVDHVFCQEPNYDDLIEPMVARRLSRIIKMGLWAGQKSLKEADINCPDKIIAGTGYGCLEDTGIFLQKMISQKEMNVNPTPFIHSTHNTISSQLAIKLQCFGYNQTYTQSAHSFEQGLLDASLHLLDDPHQHILLGGIDELTVLSAQELKRIYQTIFRRKNIFLGEGSAWFCLTGIQNEKSKANISSLNFHYGLFSTDQKNNLVNEIQALDLPTLVLYHSDLQNEEIPDVIRNILVNGNIKDMSHHLGNTPVMSAILVWIGLQELSGNPSQFFDEFTTPFKRIIIVTYSFEKYFSCITLKAC